MADSLQKTTPPFAALRVLVLEDQPFQRRLLVGLLQRAGVTLITEAGDGNEGLAALDAADRGFDIALCDLKMDGMDGIEFIRHAASRKVNAFIVTSALEPQLFSYVNNLANEFGAPILGILAKPLTLDELTGRLADYLAKAASGDEDASTATQTRNWTKDDLVAAFNRHEFIPHFQPKVRFADNRLIGVEILARWNHPDLGLLPPGEFIEVMEREGLIDRLTESMFMQTLASAEKWKAPYDPIGVAINISPLTLQRSNAAREVQGMVKQFNIPAEQITIEVTETAVSKDSAGLLETLTRLRMQGFNISVDDFGTGYSSLLQLSELPFNEIKIDRTFVHGSSLNPKALIILESIVQLALKLNVKMVAEGVESNDELLYVRDLGCTVGQGFHIARPMAEAAFVDYLQSSSTHA